MAPNRDQWKNPTLGPPGGLRGAFKGSSPPKQGNCPHHIFGGKFFSFKGSSRTLSQIHRNPKNLDPAHFWSIFPKKTVKKGQNVKRPSHFAPRWFFDFISISYYFGPKYWKYSIKPRPFAIEAGNEPKTLRHPKKFEFAFQACFSENQSSFFSKPSKIKSVFHTRI